MTKIIGTVALLASLATMTAVPAAAATRHVCGVRVVGQPAPPACVASTHTVTITRMPVRHIAPTPVGLR